MANEEIREAVKAAQRANDKLDPLTDRASGAIGKSKYSFVIYAVIGLALIGFGVWLAS